jgi:hypothetical protein
MRGNTDPCHTQRAELAIDIGTMWEHVLAAERVAGCDALGATLRQEATDTRNWIDLRFADLLDPENDKAARQLVVESADKALAPLVARLPARCR